MDIFNYIKHKILLGDEAYSYPYPECLAGLSVYEKNKKADELYRNYNKTFLDIEDACQGDFKLCSLVAYKLIVEYFNDSVVKLHSRESIFRLLGRRPNWLPVRYCGGNMVFGRVFMINICSFSSSDSVIGFRNSETDKPQIYFKILKGLKHIGYVGNWTLFKLDPGSTDDMTAMLYSPLEKNFTIEFAHFPHEGERLILFHWEDC